MHLLRDGTLAVFHDSDLKRMTGVTGVLEDCTAQDLAALHLASTPETIPQLCEVLSLYEGTGLPLVVELKSYRGNHRALAERTAKELDKYQIPYCMESFDPRCLMWLRAFRPRSSAVSSPKISARTRGDGSISWASCSRTSCSTPSPRPTSSLINLRTAGASRRICRAFYGAHMFYWTVRTYEDLKAAEREGAQAIFEGFDLDGAERKSERKEDTP